jgi:hypothetical protein
MRNFSFSYAQDVMDLGCSLAYQLAVAFMSDMMNDLVRVVSYQGLVPQVKLVIGYSPKLWIRPVPSSSKQLGNHTPHTGYVPTTLS